MLVPSLDKIYKKIIVSCQARKNSNIHHTTTLYEMCLELLDAGCVSFRLNSLSLIKKLKKEKNISIIGLQKQYQDNQIFTTRTIDDVKKLIDHGADIIAVDCTNRYFRGYSGYDFIKLCRQTFPEIIILADVSTQTDIENSINHCDILATTLRGYTPETSHIKSIDFDFIQNNTDKKPIICEGMINCNKDIHKAFLCGAWSCVVGRAITDPYHIYRNMIL